ncbi:hypothetical protein F8388_008664 [Cannabis sativa]|uniref:RNase H type-1 domain-containing protein n=1 Tax=Cannabis sativa TaxID=3483 RepID=A0A7J6GH36_CANSA|nr:hypothetical protein F8388_008664 [Cannabis sativa]
MNHILSSDYVWSSLLKDICSSNLLLEASYRLCSSSTLVRVTVFSLLSLLLNQTVSLSIEEMAQTPVPSSRRPFSSRPDAQDLQRAVDQFLHVDSPHSSPNSLHAHVSVQFPQPVLSTSPLPVSHSSSGPVMPPISTSIPVPIMTNSVSTHTAKGKGKASAISTPSHPSLSRGGKEYIAAQGNYQGDELDSEAVPISHTTQQQHSTTLHLDTPSLFVDAALDHKNGLTGTGFIFKLGYQTVLASHYRPLPGAVSPIFAEGQVLLQSLWWCLDSQLSPKFVFSDCLNLVSKVNSDWQDNSALSGLVSRIRLLFSNFPDASLHFLPRQFNMDAHGLAKEALRPREDS